MSSIRTVGVLALQGNWRHHISLCRQLGVNCVAVHTLQQLTQCHGLVIPGGESTVIARLLAKGGLFGALQQAVQRHFPILGCCAGAILLATRVLPVVPRVQTLCGIDMVVQRNAYGRQIYSAMHQISLFKTDQWALFIRAPKIVTVGAAVEVIATKLAAQHDGDADKLSFTANTIEGIDGASATTAPTTHDTPIDAITDRTDDNVVATGSAMITNSDNSDNSDVAHRNVSSVPFDIVGARHKNCMAVVFHPEETGLQVVHRRFIDDCVMGFGYTFADCVA